MERPGNKGRGIAWEKLKTAQILFISGHSRWKTAVRIFTGIRLPEENST